MSLGDVIFSAKLDTKQFDRQVADIEKKKIKSPFGKFREDITFFTAGFKASAQKMREAQKEVLGYSKVYDDLVKKGEEFKASMDSMISGPTLSQQEEWKKLSDQINQAKADMVEASNYMKHAERGFNAKNLFGKAFGRIKEFGAKILQATKGLINLGKSARGAGSSISSGLGQGIKRMLGMVGAGALLYKTFQYVREGMNNLIAYDKNTANSVNTLKNSLTALKNALASAFAPILNVVAPILAKFIGMLTTAANAVASFLSALTGKKFAVVAGGVADGFDGIGSSAGGANDSAKELQRTLMGFDKINKLDSNSGGGSGGGGGGGAGGGGGFDLVPVGDEVNKWADKFKESWENADFEWLGALLADKLNKALEKIPWDDIKEVARKIAKSIATFLNGFFGDESLWTNIGKTFAEMLNTVIEFGYSFVTNFDWKKFGKAISNAFDGFFATIDTAKAAKTLSKAIEGVLDSVITFLKETDWQQVGTKIGEFIVNIDWIGVAKKIGEAIVEAFKAISGVFEGIGTAILKGIQDYLNQKFGLKIDLTGNINKIEPDPKLNPELNTKAKFTKREDSLSDDEKTFGSKAKFTKRQDSLSGKQKTFGSRAKFTKVTDALTDKQRTISVTAKITKTITSGGYAVVGNAKNAVGGACGGIFKNGKFQKFASGGMPDGSQLFWAREAGPELVGTLGGHTAVMNNDQIVASVSSGVAKAIAGIRFKMTAPKLADMGSQGTKPQEETGASSQQVIILLTQILKAINAQDTNVYLDGEQIKNNVVRRINSHTRATGQLELIV